MRIVTSLTALLMALAAPRRPMPSCRLQQHARRRRGPKLGQLEIKAYQVIPKTKTAVQLTSDTALARNLRREVMIRLSRRGNEVGFSGGNVMRMDVSYFDFSVGNSGGGNTIGGNPSYDGPGANPRLELPSNKFEQRDGARRPTSARRRCASCSRSTRWTAARCCGRRRSSCATHAGTAEAAGIAMIDTIFEAADKNRTGDAGCPL